MANCLKSQLKGSVNNDSLIKLGHCFLHVSSTVGTNQRLGISAKYEKSFYITPLDGGYFATTLAGLDDPSSRIYTPVLIPYVAPTLYVPKMDFRIDVSDKYLIRTIGYNDSNCITSYNIEDLKYASGLEYVYAATPLCEGDISALSGKTSLLEIRTNSNNKIKGDIKSLSSCTALTNFMTSGNVLIGGNVEELCEGQLHSGRTSGNLLIYIGSANRNIKLNNSVIYSVTIKITFSSGSCTVANNTTSAVLASYDGSTWTYNS